MTVAPNGDTDGGTGYGGRRPTVRVGGTAAILAMVGLLAGCQDTSTGGSSGTGGVPPGTCTNGGNGYGGHGGDARGGSGGNGGTGGNGGNGYGGCGTGGNGYGGDGGNANGGNGAGGADGTDGVDGAPGGSFSDSGAVTGSGRLISRPIDLAGVTSVLAGAGFVVHLTRGGPAQATVRMDDNLADRVEATVSGDQLRLGIKPGVSIRNATLIAEVTVGQLDRLTASGASRVMLNPALTGPALQLVVAGTSAVTGPIAVGQVQASVSGASTLALSGQISDLRLTAAGASRLPLSDLTVGRLDAVLSGACQATVTVSDSLAARASGASVLRYRGTPSITRAQMSGASSIVRDSP